MISGKVAHLGRGRLRPRHRARFGQSAVKEVNRVNYGDSIGFEFGCHAAQHGIIAEFADTGEHRHGALVGRERIGQARPGYAPGHRRLGYLGAFESLDDAFQLTDLDPGKRVTQGFERGIGFVAVRNRDDLDLAAACRLRQQQRKRPVARNDPQLIHGCG